MKRIDSKYHIENETIIKTSNGVPIPDEEPKFLFRAYDRLALPALRAYLEICLDDGCTQYQIAALEGKIAEFSKFALDNPAKMKQPGITRGL